MNPGVMDMYQNDPDTYIDDPDEFRLYHRWLLHEQKKENTSTSITHNIIAQLDVGSNFYVFTKTNMFIYICHVKWNMKILNGSKAPAKSIGLVIIKIPKTNIIIPLWQKYYIPQIPQNKTSQIELKYYNQFRNVKT